MSVPGAPSIARSARPRGLVALAALVIAGVGVTAGYLQWKAPDLLERKAATEREIASASETQASRLATWVRFGNPQIHNRLLLMRLSERQPALATHAVGAAGGEVEIFGIDLRDPPRDLVRIDGEVLRLRVPAPRSQGRARLSGEQAGFVPVYADPALAPDPAARLAELLRWALEDLAAALERDLPGARLAIEVGPEASWSEIAAAADGGR